VTRALTADEAARRMGVKIETLYAYVSRGVIESVPSGTGRTRLFDARAVEELARRGRPRQSSRSSSLNLLIETRLTALSPTDVFYRDVSSRQLARTHTFEQVAELLWLGHVPDAHRPWTALPIDLRTSADVSLSDALRIGTAHVMALAPSVEERTPIAIGCAGKLLIASIVDALPAAGDGRTPRLVLPAGGPPLRGTIAGRLWTRLSTRRPDPGMLAVLNAALVLLADHELAASTLAVRVAASTRANPYAAALTGLSVLNGPLHGGMSRRARAMIDEAIATGPARAVTNARFTNGAVPGFGHKVYIDADPRATALLGLLEPIARDTRTFGIIEALQVEATARGGHGPNTDFALAALGRLAGMPPSSGEAIMAVARIAGWLAHAIEEYSEPPLRFRPRASYIGPAQG
jgi:citrate synthase